MSFAGKVVIVTGAGSGIGAATATLFAREGASVSLVDISADGLKTVAERIHKFGKKPLLITADVSKDDDAKSVIVNTVKTFGRLDILVNNAGILVEGKILDGTVLQAYDKVMGVNLRAMVHLTMLAAPHLVATKGNIINLSSIGAVSCNYEGFLSYCVSKAGVAHFTRGAALELAASGVRVNSVAPGPTDTNILKSSDKTIDVFANQTPLKRYSHPEEIGELILFLASEKAKGITGVDYVLDNGSLLV